MFNIILALSLDWTNNHLQRVSQSEPPNLMPSSWIGRRELMDILGKKDHGRMTNIKLLR